ncbi:membrane transport protein-domain-containing protein [Crucibulum laeve]|uniref:Membrane transport protein-domain-containing protein n=1 Tax=Crucibulum laeve TaxID=68775 RepID=A0A5C3M1K1_9AGAR|nr:membrane transport protein-domain-containing protein [Crucibulum laeve]
MDYQHEYEYDYNDGGIEDQGTPIGPLLLVVFTSILEVFLLCLAGYILAGRGILDKKTQKQLNRLNVSLFTPALLFSKVAFFLTPEKLKELWIIPIFFVIVTGLSMSVAFFLSWITGLKRSQRSFAMAAAMFMNSNSLPIALMQSLVVTVPGLRWDIYDNKNSMLGRALTYLVMYSTMGMVLRWSYGVRLLTQADTEHEPDVQVQVNQLHIDASSGDYETSALLDERSPLLGSYERQRNGEYDRSRNGNADYFTSRPSASTLVDVSGPTSSGSSIKSHSRSRDNSPTRQELTADLTKVIVAQPQSHDMRPPPRRRTTFYNSFPNSPNQSRVHLPTSSEESSSSSLTASPYESDHEGREADAETGLLSQPTSASLPTHHRRHPHAHPLHKRVWKRLTRWWVTLNDFMTVPLWAALLSLTVACIAPLQHTLENHMQPVKGAISSAGKCSIPLTLIVLGAYFYTPPPEEGASSTTNSAPAQDIGLSTRKGKGKGTSVWGSVKELFGFSDDPAKVRAKKEEPKRPGETKTVIIAVLSRMVITPVLLLPAMWFAAKYDHVPVFDDPIFVVANILLLASPPALTLAQITQTASGAAFERLISRTIFWSYCILTPFTTVIFVVVGLTLARME